MINKYVSWQEAVQNLKEQPAQIDLVRACYYDDPLTESAERFYLSTEWQAVQKILTEVEPGKALDVGAGRGISSYALAKDKWCVIALEPETSSTVGSGAIKQLLSEGLNISIVEEYGETLLFATNSFDLVYGRAILHHAANLDKFCREMVRVLKPGGMVLITREHVISQKCDLQGFLDSHPLHSLYGGENALLLAEYLRALRDAGMKIKKVLAPYDSDINLFPENQGTLREKISQRLKIPIPAWLLRGLAVPILNRLDNTPGRLYSFVGVKP